VVGSQKVTYTLITLHTAFHRPYRVPLFENMFSRRSCRSTRDVDTRPTRAKRARSPVGKLFQVGPKCKKLHFSRFTASSSETSGGYVVPRCQRVRLAVPRDPAKRHLDISCGKKCCDRLKVGFSEKCENARKRRIALFAATRSPIDARIVASDGKSKSALIAVTDFPISTPEIF
jgi:hypothetical protein